MKSHHFLITILFCCGFIIDSYSQSGTCAQAENFGFTNSTSLNCGGDLVEREFMANSSFWDQTLDIIEVEINWGDGTIETFPLTYNSTFSRWVVDANHVYIDNGTQCVYNADATLVVNGTTCTGSDRNISFDVTVYDELDNTNLGTHEINHDASSAGALNSDTEEVDVCQGTTEAIRLQDVSDFNCTQADWNSPPQTSDARNDRNRWIQWVYGTSETITGDVIIDGVPVSTFPYYGPVQHISVDDPTPPNETTLDIHMPVTAITGEYFEVTLRSWNICNPYDVNTFDSDPYNPVGGIFDVDVETAFGTFPDASEAPVETTRLIRIIDRPNPPNPVSLEICEDDNLTGINFQINNTAGSTAINWYQDNPEFGGVLVPNPNGTNSTTFPASAFPGGVPISDEDGDYALWATYVMGGTNSCESPPVQSVITVRNTLTVDDINFDTGTDQVCAGTDGLEFSLPNPPSPETYGGPTEYVWSVSDGLSIVADNGDNIVVDVDAGASGTETVYVLKRYTNNPECPSIEKTYEIEVDPQTVAGTLDGGNTICEEDNTGILMLSDYTGNVEEWQKSIDGSPYVSIGNAGNDSFSEQLTAEGTYDYRVVVKSGVCNVATSNAIRITVNDKPSAATISGDVTICEGDNATLNLSVLDGNAPYDITIDNGVGLISWSGPGDNPVVSPTTHTTYTIISVVDDNGCSVEPSDINGSATVTIGNPTDAELVGNASICSGVDTDLAVNITGGSPPYTLQISTIGTVNGYISGDPINTGPLLATTTYTLTSVEDSDGCEVLNISNDEVTVDVGVTISSATITTSDVCEGEDVVFSVDITGGAPPFELIYEIDGGADVSIDPYNDGDDINLGALTAATHTIEIVSVNDDCGNSLPAPDNTTVTVNPLPAANDQSPIVCSDDAGGNTAIVDLTDLHDAIDGSSGNTITWYEQNAPLADPIAVPASYQVTNGMPVYAEVNDGTCTDIAEIVYTVNPTPPDGAYPIDGISCSSDVNGTMISVNDPGAGYFIRWYEDNLGTMPATGITGGANGEQFIPSANIDFTYYAFVEDIVTLCRSLNGVAVQHIVDSMPSTPDAGSDDQTCNDAYVLNATPADNGGIGFWSSGGLLFFENFENIADGVQNDNEQYGWSTDISTLAAYSSPPGYFEVRDGKFTSRNLGDGSGIAIWKSESINISTINTIDISVELFKEGRLETGDFIEVYHVLDGVPVKFGELNRAVNDPTVSNEETDAVALALDVSGAANLIIEIRITSDENNDVQGFDNLEVWETSADKVSFENIFDPGTTVNALKDGPNSLFWNINSDLGACTITASEVIITKIEAPEGVDISESFCEETYLSGSASGIDLTDYNDAVIGTASNADRTVSWFTNPDWTTPVSDPTDVTVYNGDIFYPLITETVSGSGCTNISGEPGSLTFTINTLPETIDQDATNNADETVFCESGFATGVRDDIDLSILEDDINSNPAHTISWLSPSYTPVSLYTNVDGVQDGDIYYAIVTNTVTGCSDTAEVKFKVYANPLANPLKTSSSGPASTVTVCKSDDIILFQVNDPDLNSNTIYSWNIPDEAGEAVHYGGGASNFFVLLQFPNASTGMTLEVTETNVITGCTGPVNQINIIVDDVTDKPIIEGPVEVCENQENVIYEVANSQPGSTYNWSIPATLGTIVNGQGTSQITVNIAAADGTINVNEISSSGCIRPPADPFSVTIDNGPNMTSPNSLEICSKETVGDHLSFTADVSSSFSWQVTSISGSIGGATIGDVGTGDIGEVLTNFSGTDGVITYEVVPTNANGCVGTPQLLTVTVQSEPVGVDDTISVCSNVAVGYDLQNNIINDGNGLNSDFIWKAISDNPQITGESLTDNISAEIDDVLRNTGSSIQTLVYLVSPTDANNGCVGESFEITVNVQPEPVGGTDNISVCSGETINYDLQANITTENGINSSFSWVAADNPNVTGESITSITDATITDAITNTSGSIQDVIYTVIPKSNTSNCVGDPFIITVHVSPEPVFSDPVIVEICSDEPLGVVLPSTDDADNPIDTYDITAVVDPGLSGTAFTGAGETDVNAISNDRYINTSSAPLDINYTITPYRDGCEGEEFIITVTVNPEPLGVDEGAFSCSNESIGYDLQNNLNNMGNALTSQFVWKAVSDNPQVTGESLTDVAGEEISDVLINTSSTNQVVVYEVIPTDETNNCTGETFEISVSVNPEPKGIDDVASICSGEGVHYDLQNNIDVLGNNIESNFTWIASENSQVTGESTSVKTGAEITDILKNTTYGDQVVIYTVTPVGINDGCLGQPFTISVTVEPEPVMHPTLATVGICSNESTGVVFSTNGLSVTATAYDVNLVNQDADLIGTPTIGNDLAADAIENDLFRNYTSSPQQVIYQVTPKNGTCIGDPFNITVTIDPEPVLNPDLDDAVCSNEPSEIILGTNGTSVNANSFRLENIILNGAVADGSNAVVGQVDDKDLIRNDKFINNTSAPIVVEYRITPIGVGPLGCEGESESIYLTINPTPILDPSLQPAPVCSGEPSEIELIVAAGSVAAVEYDIVNIIMDNGLVAGSGNASIGPGQDANAIYNDVFTNTTNSLKRVTYKIIPVTADGCKGLVEEAIFEINPAPAMASLERVVCSEENAGIVLATTATSPDADSYVLVDKRVPADLTPVESAATGSTTDVNYLFNDVYINNTDAPLVVEYDIRPISVATCEGPVSTVRLTIEPAIKIVPDVASTSICSGSETDIELTSPTSPTSGTVVFNYSATPSSGLVSGYVPALNNLPQGYNIRHTLRNNDTEVHTVTYEIFPVANGAKNGLGCTGASETVVINVEPTPVLSVANNRQIICSGDQTEIALNSNTSPSAGVVSFVLDTVMYEGGLTGFSSQGTVFDNGDVIEDQIVNPEATSEVVTYRLVPVTSDVSCEGAAVDVKVTVNPEPAVEAEETELELCSGGFIDVALSEPRGIPNTFFKWTVVPNDSVKGELDGFGSILFQSYINNSNERQTLDYIVTPEINGCTGTPEFIQVHVDPVPDVNIDNPFISLCEGDSSNSLMVELDGNVDNTIFEWASTSSNANISGYTNGSGNNGEFIDDFLVNSGAAPGTVTYTIKPIGTEITACEGITETFIVNVGPRVTGEFISEDVIKCNDSTPAFLNLQFAGIPPFDVVLNDGTDDIVLSNISNYHVMQQAPAETTTYTIKSITDANGCEALASNLETKNLDVTVTISDVSAEFTVDDNIGCSPHTVSFTYNQVEDVTYTWSWFDGTSDSTYTATTTEAGKIITHTFENLSTSAVADLDVRLTAQLPEEVGGCIEIYTENIQIHPIIRTNVIVEGSTALCSGESLSFRNSTLGASEHRWYYRRSGVDEVLEEKTASDFISYVFENKSAENPTAYEVVYEAGNGNCNEQVIIPVTVYKGVNPGFEVVSLSEFQGGSATLELSNTSDPVDETNFSYTWKFGANSTPSEYEGATPPVVSYSSPGQKTVIVTVANNIAAADGLICTSTYTETIDVIVPPLTADFAVDPVGGCAPLTLHITENNSTGDYFEWQVIDESGRTILASNEITPTFILNTPGVYEILLESTNMATGQSEVAVMTDINVYEKPVASFDTRPDIVFMPDPLFTFNFSDGADLYSWNFGDGAESFEFEPSHSYELEGVYNVTLAAYNEYTNGLVCADTLTKEVTVREGGISILPNAFTPSPAGPSGDGKIKNEEANDIFLPLTKGVEEFEMVIYDRWGNKIFESNDQTIGWDGYNYNGELLPAGVYIYQLTLRLSNGERRQILGDIMLIR